jgi:AcrR family transcriptional regulator
MAGVRQFDEDVVLDQAITLFWQKGFAGTSMQDLAAATGVQRGSLYNAYGDKEALFLKAFEIYRERFLVQMRRSLDKPRLRDALRSFFDFVITSMMTVMQDDAPPRGCLSTKTAVGADMDPQVHAAVRALLDEYETLLEERLSRPEAGVRLRLSARDAARLIVTTTRGLVVMERVYQDAKRLRRMADTLTELLLESDKG